MESNSVMKFKKMVIDTTELKKLFDDADFDGLTLQVSQELGANSPNEDQHKFKLIAYKHFSSRKKQEKITDPAFFVSKEGVNLYTELKMGNDGVVSHFGNMKLTRADMNESIETAQFPYLIITPQHGSGDFENYIVCTAVYSNEVNAETAGLSRGFSKKTVAMNPSPPA